MSRISKPCPPTTLWFAAFGLLLLTISRSYAFSALHYELIGVVTVIDPTAHTFAVQPTAGSSVVTLHWDRDTAFFSDGTRVKADALPLRGSIKVRYVVPWFGKPEATRVAWRSSATGLAPGPNAPRVFAGFSRDMAVPSVHARLPTIDLLGEKARTRFAHSSVGLPKHRLDIRRYDLNIGRSTKC